MTGEPMARLEQRGRTLMDGIAKILADRGVAASVQGVPAMFGIYLGETPPTDFRSAADHDTDRYETLVMGMIERGVMPSPDALEPWFLCAALSEEDVATTLMVFQESLAAALA